MKKMIIAFSLILPLLLNAQNLVVNPGFEIMKKGVKAPECSYTKQENQFNKRAEGWDTFSGLTPDLIAFPKEDSVQCIYPEPFQGHHMAGVILYHPGTDSGYDYDYHEYIQGRLTNALVPGETYQIDIWIQQTNKTAIDHLNSVFRTKAQVYPIACNNLGIRFEMSPERPEVNYRRAIRDFNITPQVVFEEIIETKEGEWKKIAMSYVPDRPYQFFVIGNFSSDFRTETNIDNGEAIEEYNYSEGSFYNKKKRIAYYCLDELSIARVDPNATPEPEPETVVAIETSLKESNTYTFQNVNFETNKWDLLSPAKAELDALAGYLNDHLDIKIEIEGHTDNIGDEVANQSLSEKRAAAVHEYLLQKITDPERLTYVGYGEEKPVADNDSPEGRSQNRRVECRIMDQ